MAASTVAARFAAGGRDRVSRLPLAASGGAVRRWPNWSAPSGGLRATGSRCAKAGARRHGRSYRQVGDQAVAQGLRGAAGDRSAVDAVHVNELDSRAADGVRSDLSAADHTHAAGRCAALRRAAGGGREPDGHRVSTRPGWARINPTPSANSKAPGSSARQSASATVYYFAPRRPAPSPRGTAAVLLQWLYRRECARDAVFASVASGASGSSSAPRP